MQVGYYTGLRLTKAATLRWDMVDFTKKPLFVRKPGKRGKAVLLPLHEKLHGHLMTVVSNDQAEEYVMPTLASSDSGGKRGLGRNLKEILIKAGVDLR